MSSQPLELSTDEKARILAGDETALKRHERPDVEPGQTIVLRRRAAHFEVLHEAEYDPRKITGKIEVPERLLVWIEVEKVTERLGREYRYHVHFKLHDAREKVRRLGRPTAGEKLTDEVARGYGGPPIDELEAVDDETLKAQKVRSDESWAVHLRELDAAEERRRQLRALRQRVRERLVELPSEEARDAFLARVHRVVDEEAA